MKSKFLFVAIFAFLSILGCKKDGIAATERLIPNTWKLNKYSVNSIDKTSSLVIRDFTEKLEDESYWGYSYWCIDSNQDSIVERFSTYQIYADGDSVSFYASYLIPLTVEDTIDGYRYCKITLLSRKNFTYEFQLKGRLHKFEMVKI